MTDLALTAWIIASIPLLAVAAILLFLFREWVRARKPRRLSKNILMRDYESRMGQYLIDYKPRTTIHSIVNRLYVTPEVMRSFRAILQQEQFSDVSFWQGDINWQKMRTKARKVVIRAGQNLWQDIKFIWNWTEARKAGFIRDTYFFYDGRVSPGAQAALLVGLIKHDLPEIVWIDWEKNFGGPHEGLKNVVAMMQEVERLLPGVTVGMYTGYYWFIENSNPIWNAAQYKYLSARPLWEAWYGSNVKIPAPWVKMRYHQFGTPAVGLEWGVESKEIDLNIDMEGDPDPTPIPDPEPDEETMITFTGKTLAGSSNVRVHPDTSASIVTALAPGTAFEAVGYKFQADGYFWLNLVTPVAGWLAITSNIEHQPVTPPAPVPADVVRVSLAQTIKAEINGVSYVARVDAADVEMVRE